MSYQFIADRIEVRGVQENNKPRYIVKATAMIANKKHTYQYEKNKDGSVKTLKSMFTPHFIESVKEQAKHRNLFIDIQHELARDSSIKSIVKGKVTPEEEKQISNMLERKRLPLAKINDINIYDNKLDLETELNPMFKEVDEEHSKYFDAVWYSLQNKYLNGVSVTFGDFKYAKDEQGDMVIDDGEVLGFSYLDSPADPDNSIYEVAIRAIEEGISIRGVEKMEEEKKNLEAERAKIEVEKKQIEEEKLAIQKQKEDAKQVEIKRQEEEHKKVKEELDKKTDELKKAQEDSAKAKEELNSAKGTVKPKDRFADGGSTGARDSSVFPDRLKEITAEHDATMGAYKRGQQPMINNALKGFGEMVNLQAKANRLTAGLERGDAEFIEQGRMLDKSRSDVIAPKQ